MRRSMGGLDAGAGLVRRVVWAAKSELQALSIFRWSHVTNIFEHQTKAVFHLKLMVGWGEHKVVLDESGIRVYCLHVNWGLNFVSLWAIRPGAATGLRFSTR